MYKQCCLLQFRLLISHRQAHLLFGSVSQHTDVLFDITVAGTMLVQLCPKVYIGDSKKARNDVYSHLNNIIKQNYTLYQQNLAFVEQINCHMQLGSLYQQ